MEAKHLSNKFLKGWLKEGMTVEDLKDWKYCGGDRGRHLNYFDLSCPDWERPPHSYECVCGHSIQENCYITNGQELLVLGNDCIKKFIPKSGRTCELCGSSHKNRKVNLCNKCK